MFFAQKNNPTSSRPLLVLHAPGGHARAGSSANSFYPSLFSSAGPPPAPALGRLPARPCGRKPYCAGGGGSKNIFVLGQSPFHKQRRMPVWARAGWSPPEGDRQRMARRASPGSATCATQPAWELQPPDAHTWSAQVVAMRRSPCCQPRSSRTGQTTLQTTSASEREDSGTSSCVIRSGVWCLDGASGSVVLCMHCEFAQWCSFAFVIYQDCRVCPKWQ